MHQLIESKQRREGNGDAVGEAEYRIGQLQEPLLCFTEQQQYVMNEKKLKGAEEMAKLIITCLKSSSRKKPRGDDRRVS